MRVATQQNDSRKNLLEDMPFELTKGDGPNEWVNNRGNRHGKRGVRTISVPHCFSFPCRIYQAQLEDMEMEVIAPALSSI